MGTDGKAAPALSFQMRKGHRRLSLKASLDVWRCFKVIIILSYGFCLCVFRDRVSQCRGVCGSEPLVFVGESAVVNLSCLMKSRELCGRTAMGKDRIQRWVICPQGHTTGPWLLKSKFCCLRRKSQEINDRHPAGHVCILTL